VIGFEFMLGKVSEILCLIYECRDHIMENPEKKLEMQYLQNKFKLRNMKYPMAGALKLPIL